MRTIELARRHPWLSAVWVALAIGALVQPARLVAYALAPGAAGADAPPTGTYASHSCLTAYYEAGRLSLAGEETSTTPWRVART